jgi:hypothetical protein
LRGGELLLAGGRVAAEGQDVLHAFLPQLVEDAPDFVGGMADAGEVGHRA